VIDSLSNDLRNYVQSTEAVVTFNLRHPKDRGAFLRRPSLLLQVEGLPVHFGQKTRYVSGPVSVVVGYLTLVLRSSSHYTGVTTTGLAQVDVKNSAQFI